MTDTVRVPREAVEEIADDLRAISLELTKKRATTPVSEDIFRKALALEAMLAASPQGEGLTVDALAQEIRRVDGGNTLGAGALAEALMPFLASPQGEGSSGDPAPIKPSADTGELRERVAREIWEWPFPIIQHEGCFELADAILDLIQSERLNK